MEQAINFVPEIFSFLSYLYFAYISPKPKGTSNKFGLRNILIPMIPILYLYFIINQKEQAINFLPEIFSFL